jgi:hypothetical protein
MASAAPTSSNPAPMILGIISIVLGVIGSIISMTCCGLVIGMPIGGVGLLLGAIGLIIALVNKQGMVLPILGTTFSVLSLIIGGAWLVAGAYKANQIAKQEEADRNAVRDAVSAPAVTAEDLGAAYSADEKSADAKYKDKVLDVTGEVVTFDNQSLHLRTNNALTQVICIFDDDSVTRRPDLVVGKRVTLRGKLEGQTLFQLPLKHCKLVKAPH